MLFNFSIDATGCDCLGRFINDSPRKTANCVAKPVAFDGQPHVLFFACKDITSGTELRYDYGGFDMPWRKVRI